MRRQFSAALEYAAQIQRGVATNTAAATAAANRTAGYNLFNPNPPNTLALYPTSNSVQVVLTQPWNTIFANIVTAIWGPSVNTVNITTPAIAEFSQTSTACLLALDPTAPNAVSVDNGTLSNRNCWVASNSSSGSALNCNNCTITGPTTVVGGDAVSNGGRLNGSSNRTYASAIADPYAGVSFTPTGTCLPMPTGAQIGPDHYCSINVTTTLTMTPGVYYIDNTFNIQNGARLTASGGVTIVINGDYQIYVGPNSTLTIIAPTGGPFPGIAISDPSALPMTQEFAGNSRIHIQGAIYFPHQTIQFDSGSQLDSSLCTQIIADQIRIESNVNISNNCSGTGVVSIPVLEVYLAS
jgi:hypothetical protein